MIKVLHMFTTLDCGGVESFLYNYYSSIDRKKVRFDIIVPGNEIGYLEPEFRKMGSNVFHVSTAHKNFFKQYKEINQIIKNGNYDIIHCHGYKSIIGLVLGKKNKCKVRIIHSHMAYVKENVLDYLFRKFCLFLIKVYSTDKFACGIDAAKWLYGKSDYEKGNVTVINNAINLDKYYFNKEIRNLYKKKLNLDNNIIIGNIARLTYQKNQLFLLEIMKIIVKKNKNYKLLLVGNGEDEELLKDSVEKMGLNNNVIFLGLRKDVPELLSVMDIFALPSRYEGLPVVLAEAQASGIVSLVSDNITQELNITNTIKYLPIFDVESANYWANEILKFDTKTIIENREKNCKLMQHSIYDIKEQSKLLLIKYQELIKKR